MKIFTNPHMAEFQPKIQLPECGCSYTTRTEFNKWLEEMFGQQRFVYVSEFGDAVWVHPNTYTVFKEMANGNS